MSNEGHRMLPSLFAVNSTVAGIFGLKRYFRMRRTDIENISFRILGSMLTDAPLKLVAYWGIGGKKGVTEAEDRALAFQSEWLRILNREVGIEVTIAYLITDTHAVVNGVAADAIASYSDAVQTLLHRHGHSSAKMRDVIPASLLPDFDGLLRDEQHDSDVWRQVSPSARRALARCAAYHARRNESSERTAQRYYLVNRYEAALVTIAFPNSCFLSYQNHGLRFLLPNMPTIFCFVGADGLVRRPWFSDSMKGHWDISD